MRYEVHFGVELPFWLALPAEEFSVVLDGAKHRVKTSNEVVRMDVGDFYRRPDGYLVVWEDENRRETRLRELENQHPELRPFQRKAKTVVTHIRDVDAADDAAVQDIYKTNASRWTDESCSVVNRLIDWYRFITPEPASKREAANVSKWDLVSAIVSLWDMAVGMRQVGGTIQPLAGPALSPPLPLSHSYLEQLKAELVTGKQPPIVQSLFNAANSNIPRGAYRNVTIDAVTALEMAVEEAIQKSGRRKKLRQVLIDYLLRSSSGSGSFDKRCKKIIPALGGPNLPIIDNSLWQNVKTARDKRHAIVHKGQSATESEALDAVSACTQAALKLTQGP